MHGCWLAVGDRQLFENALNEADTDPLADFDSGFDSQLGFAVLAHCAPLLGLPRHPEPQQYWDRRSRYGATELARLFLGAAGVSDWLVDTGLTAEVAGCADLPGLSGGRAHEVVRLEQVAEQAIATAGDAGSYASAFEQILHRRTATAVATKSILAYRDGFDGDLSEPTSAQVAAAAGRWRAEGGVRLHDRVLLRFGLHQALRIGKPLQLHVGFGDRDGDLRRANPLYLRDFLQQAANTPIVLLHCYPYEREAGYLAQAYNNVYLDGGLAINHLGARGPAFVARLLELAPFRKIVYSSDGFGPAELHYLGAALWRRAMDRVLGGFVADGDWSEADARRVVDLIAHRNAARVYQLDSAR
ncbi:MAG TPA: amidohydrolase family protein [Mycobacterium sp.]|nr:amidohydrolase family protein [Mycobacterium sp.]